VIGRLANVRTDKGTGQALFSGVAYGSDKCCLIRH
jgi:hypothetical protein